MERLIEFLKEQKEMDDDLLAMQEELSGYQEEWEAGHTEQQEKDIEESKLNIRRLI